MLLTARQRSLRHGRRSAGRVELGGSVRASEIDSENCASSARQSEPLGITANRNRAQMAQRVSCHWRIAHRPVAATVAATLALAAVHLRHAHGAQSALRPSVENRTNAATPSVHAQ